MTFYFLPLFQFGTIVLAKNISYEIYCGKVVWLFIRDGKEKREL